MSSTRTSLSTMTSTASGRSPGATTLQLIACPQKETRTRLWSKKLFDELEDNVDCSHGYLWTPATQLDQIGRGRPGSGLSRALINHDSGQTPNCAPARQAASTGSVQNDLE